MYSCTISLTSAPDGVGGQRDAPAALPSRRTWYPLFLISTKLNIC